MNRPLCGFAFGIACVACGQDVRLGTVAADGAIDVVTDSPSGNPFTPGGYTLHFLGPEQTSCMGSLGPGDEPSFSGITVTSLGLVDGVVTIVTPSATLMSIAGSPILSALGQASIDLVPGDPNSSPEIWGGTGVGSFISGPISTTNTMRFIGADSTTGHNASGVDAVLGLLYETANGMGACVVSFPVLFTQP